MRYTRYEYKRPGKFKFLITIGIVVCISIGGGLYISRVIFDGKQIKEGVSTSAVEKSKSDISNKSIMALQCGYYSKKENADASMTALVPYCQPFLVEENGNYRVLAGIYDEDSGIKKLEQLKSNGIDVAKVNLNLPSETIEDKKIIEIIEGFLQITNKFEESDVKSIKTSEFKTWESSIINDGRQSEGEKIKQIDNYVKSLPDELDKNNASENVKGLYEIVTK